MATFAIESSTGATLWAVRFLRQNPNCWAPAALPALLVLALSTVFTWAVVDQLSPALADAIAPTAESWAFLWHAIRWLSVLAVGYLGVVLSLFLAPILSGPALERLVALVEGELDAPPRTAQGFWFETSCGLRSQLVLAAVSLPLLGGLSVASWLLPWLSPVLVTAQTLVVALGLAWSLVDYPMTLRGLTPAQRWSILRSKPLAVLSLGLQFAVLFWIPAMAVVLLPLGVVAATRVVWTQWPEELIEASLLPRS